MSRARARRSLPTVTWASGIHIDGSPLWLDALEPTELCFVSHAHLPQANRHKRTLATARTVQLYGDKLARRPALLPCGYRRPFALGDFELELFPSGHMLGAAQLRVRTPQGDLVYTG